MKKKFAALLVAVMLVLLAATAAAAGGGYYEKMIALKDQYPEGMHWTNDNYYAWKGGIFSGGYGCAGFAFLLSDAAFGSLPARRVAPVRFEDVRVGDILRVNGDSHSVIVLEVRESSVVIAEGNYNSSIHWGRILSRSAVENANYMLTRYPETAPEHSQPLIVGDIAIEITPDNQCVTVYRPQITGGLGNIAVTCHLLDADGHELGYVVMDNRAITIMPGENGTYQIRISVETWSASGERYTADKYSDAFTLTGYGVTVTPLTVSGLNSFVSEDGRSIYIDKPQITGGTGNYTIAYNIYDDRGRAVNYFYSGEAHVAATPGENGRYNVYVVVQDGQSEVIRETGWITLTGYERFAPLGVSSLTYEVSPDGCSLYINRPTITGGTGNYTIAYNIYDDQGNAVNYFYSSEERVAATPGRDGRFNVAVVVRDGQSEVQRNTDWHVLAGEKTAVVAETLPEDETVVTEWVEDATPDLIEEEVILFEEPLVEEIVEVLEGA